MILCEGAPSGIVSHESRRIDATGGAKSPSNYNEIESPGKSYRDQDETHWYHRLLV